MSFYPNQSSVGTWLPSTRIPEGPFNASQYYKDIASPQYPEYTPPVSYDTKKYRSFAMGSFVSGIILLVIIIVVVVIYVIYGDKYNKEKVKEELEDGSDIDARFGSLTVNNNTILGNSSSDRLALNGRILTDIIPAQDSSISLGSATKKWDVTYTDAVIFENGVSMISDSEGIQLTGSFGYRRKVKPLTLDNTSYTLPHTESGYLYVLNETDVPAGSTAVYLPDATGSGTFYDFVAGTSIGTQDFTVVASGDVIKGNMKLVSENTGPGSSELATIMTTGTSANTIVIDDIKPINISTGYNGIMTGSNWRLIDYGASVWIVSGTMILQSGPSVGLFTSPFS